MTLPKVTTPKYDLSLPISGKTIKFRPFLVKEQKVLLQALEMGNENQTLNAQEDIIRSCTFNEIDIDKLPVADVEFLLLAIRSKSVGETVDMFFRCQNTVPDADGDPSTCAKRIPVSVNLNDVELDAPEKNKKVMLSDSVGVLLREINWGDAKKIRAMQSEVDQAYATILACVDNVFDAENVYSRTDFSDAELKDFFDNLYATDFKGIEQFATKIPTVHKKFDIQCPACHRKEQVELRGIADFLA